MRKKDEKLSNWWTIRCMILKSMLSGYTVCNSQHDWCHNFGIFSISPHSIVLSIEYSYLSIEIWLVKYERSWTSTYLTFLSTSFIFIVVLLNHLLRASLINLGFSFLSSLVSYWITWNRNPNGRTNSWDSTGLGLGPT